jgi:hypothetical protein
VVGGEGIVVGANRAIDNHIALAHPQVHRAVEAALGQRLAQGRQMAGRRIGARNADRIQTEGAALPARTRFTVQRVGRDREVARRGGKRNLPTVSVFRHIIQILRRAADVQGRAGDGHIAGFRQHRQTAAGQTDRAAQIDGGAGEAETGGEARRNGGRAGAGAHGQAAVGRDGLLGSCGAGDERGRDT